MNTKTVLIMFYRPPPNDHFINRLTAFVNPPFAHTEIGFPQDYCQQSFFKSESCDAIMASSIFAEGQLFFRPRSFRNPSYEIVAINVSAKSFETMYTFCKLQESNNVSFDGLGMYLAMFPFKLRNLPLHKTFCSAHVVEVLQRGNVQCVQGLTPETTTPSLLFKKLSKCHTLCFSTLHNKFENKNDFDTRFI